MYICPPLSPALSAEMPLEQTLTEFQAFHLLHWLSGIREWDLLSLQSFRFSKKLPLNMHSLFQRKCSSICSSGCIVMPGEKLAISSGNLWNSLRFTRLSLSAFHLPVARRRHFLWLQYGDLWLGVLSFYTFAQHHLVISRPNHAPQDKRACSAVILCGDFELQYNHR